MGLHLKITVGLLLLIQAFHLASLQYTTDSPGRTIDRKWLRDLAKDTAGSPNAVVAEEETDDQGLDATEISNEFSSGIASGSMVVHNTEEENLSPQDKSANETSDDLTAINTTLPDTFPTNVTTKQPLLPDTTVSPTNGTSDPTNSNQTNMTKAEEEFHDSTTTTTTTTPQDSTTHLIEQNPKTHLSEQNSTTHLSEQNPKTHLSEQNSTTHLSEQNSTTHLSEQNSTTHLSEQNSTTHLSEQNSTTHLSEQNPQTHLSEQNSTSSSNSSNHTDLQTTTFAPDGHATQGSTTKSDKHTGSTNVTESTNTTTVTTTTKPEIKEASTTSSSTRVLPSEAPETSPAPTTTTAPITPEKANKTDKDAASGSSLERGLATDHQKSKRHGVWGAVLGTAVAVACVGLVAYIILKKKHRKGFSHSKLVEEFPSDPVLRLDNDPLDLNFGLGGSAYYNPALQGDSIQMSNFPGRR